MGIKAWSEFDISSVESIQVFNYLEEKIANLEQQAESQNIVSIPTNIELAPGKVYDLSKSYNCRNCGAPIRSCICEYCGTVYKNE